MPIEKGLILKTNNSARTAVAILGIFLAGLVSSPAFAQYSGGPQTNTAETTIGSDIFKGGSQNGLGTATSGAGGSLAHGAATKLLFTTIPSTTKHFD